MTRPTGLRMLLASFTLAVTAPALAHPGHGRDGGSHELTHYFTEPEHLTPVLLAVLAGAVAATIVSWYRRKT